MIRWLHLIFVAISAHALGAARVATSGPDSAELLAQLGLGDRLVATTVPEFLSPPLDRLASLGPLYSPSVEALVRVRPDLLVIDRSLGQVALQRFAEQFRYPSVEVDIHSLESLATESERLLDAIDPTGSRDSLERLRACLASLRKHSGGGFTFLVFAWLDPPILYGHGTIVVDLIERLGGTGILPPGIRNPYPQIAVEWLMRRRPDRVFNVVNSPAQAAGAADTFRRWWGEEIPPTTVLSADHFSRKNFAPLRGLSELDIVAKEALREGCGEL